MISKVVFVVDKNESYMKDGREFSRTIGLQEIEVVKENYSLHFSIRYNPMYWINNNQKIHPSKKVIQCYPSEDWNFIICIHYNENKDKEEIYIYNADGTVRHIINIPDQFVNKEAFLEHLSESQLSKKEHFKEKRLKAVLDDDQAYPVEYYYLGHYFNFEGNSYIELEVIKNIYRGSIAITQKRYIDAEKGTFLPFTKQICYMTPNPYDQTYEKIQI